MEVDFLMRHMGNPWFEDSQLNEAIGPSPGGRWVEGDILMRHLGNPWLEDNFQIM